MENLFTGTNTKDAIGTISGEILPDFSKGFASDLRQLGAIGVRPKININSPGGSVFAGFEIIDAMIDTEVDTHIMGMAFSMAGIISQFGKHRTANDFSMLMIHAASGGQKELVEKMNDQLKNILESRSHLSRKQLDDIFNNSKDVFFDSSEMLELGLIDEIINTDVKITNFDNTENVSKLYEIYNSALDELDKNISEKNGGGIQTSFFETSKPVNTNIRIDKYTMDEQFKEVKAHLQLDSSDTSKEVLNSLKVRDKEFGELKAALKDKDEKIEGLEKNISSMNEQKAVDLVNKAKEDGKISADAVEHFTAFAKSNYEGCKKAIEGITAEAKRESILDNVSKTVTLSSDDKILEKGYANLAANEPEVLKLVSEENPDLFNKLIDNHNKTK